MRDQQFLLWLRDRLIHQYKEDENSDFVTKLEAVALSIDPHEETPNVGRNNAFVMEDDMKFALLARPTQRWGEAKQWYIVDRDTWEPRLWWFDDEELAKKTLNLLNIVYYPSTKSAEEETDQHIPD